MKICSLDLLAFGPFTDKTLDLREGRPGLHVVYGPNEAGKSSALRALKGLLFGIDGRSRDNFVHKHSEMRVGGSLELAGGDLLACVRRKGNKNTLLSPDSGDPIGDDILQNLLPGLDGDRFLQLHGIDHDELVRGGRAVLEQGGDLGRSLFGATGAGGSKDILEELGKGAEQLFKPRGGTQVVNAAVAQLKAARKEEKDSRVSASEYKKLQKELNAADEAVAGLDSRLDEVSGHKSRLERFKRVAGTLEDRRGLLARRLDLGEVVDLPEDFDEQRRKALETRARAQATLQEAESKLESRRADAQALDVPREILDNQATIEELHLHYGAVKKHEVDIPRQDGQRRGHRNAAGDLLGVIRPDLTLDDVDQLRPLLNRQKTLAGLAGDSKLLGQRLASSDTTLGSLREEHAALAGELETIPGAGRDVVPLKAAVAAARSAGHLEGRLQKARESAGAERKTCEREFGRLGRFRGSLEELAAVALPGDATLQRFERAFSGLEEQARDRGRQRSGLTDRLADDEEHLAALLKGHEVPTLEEQEQAREHRDGGWKLVRKRYVDGQDAGDGEAAFAGGLALADAYERSVEAADDVADRLRAAAERVERRATLEAAIEKTRESLDELAGEDDAHAEALARLQADWVAAWTGVADQPGTPGEMREWLQKTGTLLQRHETLEKALDEVQGLEAERQAHLEAVGAELQLLDDEAKVEGVGLEELLTRGEQLVDAAETAARRRTEIERALGKLEVKIRRASDERRQAQEEQERWKEDWAKAVKGLGLDDEPLLADQALEIMERVVELFRQLQEAESARKRIHGMQQEGERFAAAVRAFAARAGIELGEQEPGPFVLQLVDRLGKARAAAASLDKLQSAIRELEEVISGAELRIEAARERLAGLRAKARVETDDELEPAWGVFEESRRLSSRIEELERQLRQSGDGLSIEALEAEAAELDPDQVDGELSRLSGELGGLRKERDSALAGRQTALDKIKALDGSSMAAEAAERAEELVAGLVPDVEQYLRLQIARLILEQQQEQYRKENQTPVLKRAGELFARLTLGSFKGLRDDLDDKGKPVLMGVRADDGEVTVDGMSDGTRDQLFLALRLATLELEIDKTREPVPFVVDDILVGFDDARSKACLEVLAELAQQTQVLLFTHHRAVAEVARELGEEDGVFVADLS